MMRRSVKERREEEIPLFSSAGGGGRAQKARSASNLAANHRKTAIDQQRAATAATTIAATTATATASTPLDDPGLPRSATPWPADIAGPRSSHQDQRSDRDILTSLNSFQPVSIASEKNIWAFWHAGLSACKPWCQRNIISWVRRHDASWTVRVLDAVDGSPNHWSRYIPGTWRFFPEALLGDSLKGAHTGPHAADLLRLPLLYLHGGIWIDVGFMLFRDVGGICWDKLADSTTSWQLAGFRMAVNEEVIMFWNGFIAARKGCLAVKYWHDIFVKVWEGVESTAGMSHHPLLRHIPRYEVPPLPGEQLAFDYARYVDYIAQMFCLERLRHVRDPEIDWDGPAFFADSVLLYDCATEVYWAQVMTKWDGRKQYILLNRRRDDTDHDFLWHKSEAFISSILVTSSTMKLSHGLLTDQREYVARIWDEPVNSEADIAPGTFAAYLRWASIHYCQEKELNALVMPIRAEALLTGGLLEAQAEIHPHWQPGF